MSSERKHPINRRREPARRRSDPIRNSLPGLALIVASVLPAALNPTPALLPPPDTAATAAAHRTTDAPTAGATTPPATAAAGQRIFFGSLHSHTRYSDGSGTPADAFTRARDQGRMDFLAVTEHNHSAAENSIGSGDPRRDGILIATQPDLYNGTNPASLVSAARSFTVDDSFVAIAGQEFSTISSGNHVNVFDIGRVIDVANGDYAALYDNWLPQNPDSLNEPPLIQFNHPNYRADLEYQSTPDNQRFNDYGLDDYNRDFGELVRRTERYASLIEIVSGPALKDGENLPITSGNRHEKDYWFYLNQGFRLAPTANQDNHYLTWGTITRARTAVLADRLTKADILRALKARRVYATEDDNLQVRFNVNGQPMGSLIRTPQPLDLNIEVELSDPDEPGAQYRVELYRDEVGGPLIDRAVEESRLEGDGRISFSGQRFESATLFYFIKVSQVGSDGREEFAWTAPVWIELGEPTPQPTPQPTPTPGATPAAVRFVHSRNSEIYHFSNCTDAARIKPENLIENDVPPEDKTLHLNCPRGRQ